MAEGARLEIVCMPTKVYRGFKSRSLRHKYKIINNGRDVIKGSSGISRTPGVCRANPAFPSIEL